jgi:hypothetical protein
MDPRAESMSWVDEFAADTGHRYGNDSLRRADYSCECGRV